MTELTPSFSKREGLTLRALDHGGFLVTHPDIYTVAALYFAATTIDEAFEFMREHLAPSAVSCAEQAFNDLRVERDALLATLEWMENLDPQLVDAAREKFGLVSLSSTECNSIGNIEGGGSSEGGAI